MNKKELEQVIIDYFKTDLSQVEIATKLSIDKRKIIKIWYDTFSESEIKLRGNKIRANGKLVFDKCVCGIESPLKKLATHQENCVQHSHTLYIEDNKDEWVECKICDFRNKKISAHIKNIHNLTTEQYKEQYGGEVLSKQAKNVALTNYAKGGTGKKNNFNKLIMSYVYDGYFDIDKCCDEQKINRKVLINKCNNELKIPIKGFLRCPICNYSANTIRLFINQHFIDNLDDEKHYEYLRINIIDPAKSGITCATISEKLKWDVRYIFNHLSLYRSVSESRPYSSNIKACYICGDKKYRYSLRDHLLEKHYGAIVWLKCEVCNEEFTSLRALNTHISLANDIKHKQYYLSKIEEQHLEGIEDVDYVECKICNTRRLNLEQHITKTHKISILEYKKKYNSKTIATCLEKNKEYFLLKIKKHNLKYKGIECIDYVECKICGFRRLNLEQHIVNAHDIDIIDYEKQYNTKAFASCIKGNRGRFGTPCYSIDKHFCGSEGEKFFDDWLYERSIEHVPHKLIGYGKKRCDQYIEYNNRKIYIEYDGFGLLRRKEEFFDKLAYYRELFCKEGIEFLIINASNYTQELEELFYGITIYTGEQLTQSYLSTLGYAKRLHIAKNIIKYYTENNLIKGRQYVFKKKVLKHLGFNETFTQPCAIFYDWLNK